MNPESELAMMAYKAAGKMQPVSAKEYFEHEPVCDPWEDCPPEDPGPVDPPPPPPPPLQPADPRPVPHTVSFNNCSMNTDVNYPSGRITVEETQWGNGGTAYEGVADIKIEILGPNGQRVVTQTNRYGCFKASGAIRGFRPPIGPKLPVIMNVHFESNRKEIRGYNDAANLAQYTQSLKHIWGNIAYSMNSANVSYERHTGKQDNDTKYYVAATVNNALYEFDEYATQDGILPPPYDLKVMVHIFSEAGATPMFNNIRKTHPFEYTHIKAFFDATTLGVGIYLSNQPPDVLIGYDWNAGQFATDQIKETAYHEFAHASHYQKTSFAVWRDNINYIAHYGLGSNPYGDAGDPGVERTDLIEMWGYFMGREYVHRRYGPTRHSLAATPTFINSWYRVNEIRLFDWDHIPSGFLHDIMDNNIYNRNDSLLEDATVTFERDSIQGFTISTVYNLLHINTTSAASLINQLRAFIPTNFPGNNFENYDTLATRYGY